MGSLKTRDVVKDLSATRTAEYNAFDRIDGSHSMKAAIPNGYVEYQVRTRHGGSVFYFNFDLAREMGLIPSHHPDELTPKLKEKILETFSIVIINEYDIQKKIEYPKKDIRANTYMATRYLQLQHPSRQGKTSGDGRGIWNGEIKHKGVTWDVSSSGTGATRLSPAHAQTKKFFKTGDRIVGYGNGYNYLNDGLSAAIMSEIFHKNGIETERTLAIISFEGGSSINVRAGKNLMRPAHFFHQLKQTKHADLKASIDYFIERQLANGAWPKKGATTNKAERYRIMAEEMALTFSRIAAQFESEYIFCWLDWDGDNILADGGIIDYGSIRQFGLYHHEYRYDDVDRMSTTIPEQKLKARYIVQNFAQIRDFLTTGRKKNIRRFRRDSILKLFDQNFKRVLHELLLKKIGLSEKQIRFVLEKHEDTVRSFKGHHSYFEKTKSSKGIYKISDGITCDAVFCMKDLHRELPKRMLEKPEALDADTFISLMKSSFARPFDLRVGAYRRTEIATFQELYLKLAKIVSDEFHGGNLKKTFLEFTMRASVANLQDRITGDSILHLTSTLIRNQKKLSFDQKLHIIDCVIRHQVEQVHPEVKPTTTTGKIVLNSIKAIQDYREGF